MSHYVTIQGSITYHNKIYLDKAVDILQKGGWINKDLSFTDECNSPYDTNFVDYKNLTLRIPYGCHRNLGRVVDSLWEGAREGLVVGTSTDGCFDGWVVELTQDTSPRGKLKEDLNIHRKPAQQYWDLTEWAKAKGKEIVEYDDNVDMNEEYYEWQNQMEEEFHDYYMR